MFQIVSTKRSLKGAVCKKSKFFECHSQLVRNGGFGIAIDPSYNPKASVFAGWD